MSLRAQRFRQRLGGVELAGQGLELGAVAQRHDGPEGATFPFGGTLAHDEQPLIGQVQFIDSRTAVEQQLSERVR